MLKTVANQVVGDGGVDSSVHDGGGTGSCKGGENRGGVSSMKYSPGYVDPEDPNGVTRPNRYMGVWVWCIYVLVSSNVHRRDRLKAQRRQTTSYDVDDPSARSGLYFDESFCESITGGSSGSGGDDGGDGSGGGAERPCHLVTRAPIVPRTEPTNQPANQPSAYPGERISNVENTIHDRYCG
ncbi:hypothetical protein M0802_009796 [Mischocyttarus mexicanus]|nr:hypothetical protein M0802_009796 [Mischocyttarus mexicanus]